MRFDVIDDDPTNFDELRICDFDGMVDWFSNGSLPCVFCKLSCGSAECRKKVAKWLKNYDQN